MLAKRTYTVYSTYYNSRGNNWGVTYRRQQEMYAAKVLSYCEQSIDNSLNLNFKLMFQSHTININSVIFLRLKNLQRPYKHNL